METTPATKNRGKVDKIKHNHPTPFLNVGKYHTERENQKL